MQVHGDVDSLSSTVLDMFSPNACVLVYHPCSR
jgi:hypothetical protein